MSETIPFLRQVARIYLEREGDRLQEYCFVFPNRRSSLFFRKYLAMECARPLFAPTLTTISDFFVSLADLKTADELSLLYELYLSYRRVADGFLDTFDDFLRYGDVILGDFDDIDKYMADASAIFRNLCDLKKLDDTEYEYLSPRQRAAIQEFWSSVRIGKKNSDAFLGAWRWLHPVYEDLKKALAEKNIGYSGMIQRSVVENIGDIMASMKYERVVFIGFNALSACEAALMTELRKEGKGDFYWDYPGSLLKNPENRACHFMMENLTRYPSRYQLVPESDESLPKIQVIGIPSGVGQAKALPEIIGEVGGGAPLGELSTCVVLPDSSLLHPVLNSIPENVETVNVTMGYPLRESSVAFFMGLVAQLQMKALTRGGEVCFHHLQVEGIIEHPFIRKVAGEAASALKQEIVNRNMIYVTPDKAGSCPILKRIFVPAGMEHISEYLLDVLEVVRESAADLDREYMYHYGVCVRRLASLGLEVKVSTWFSILNRMISGISVPLSGEPLSGLQIMGPLETMALDFKNVIILSMNDGIFPSRSVRDSMIPYNLRRGFGLPTFEVQDAISAYHFYRSIARAERVYFLYDTRTSVVGGSEVSRYISQLKYHHRIPMEEKTVIFSLIRQETAGDVSVERKTPDVISKLMELKYSASSLLTYLNCPLQFYYSNVCGFADPDEVADEVDASSFGNIYHKTMELLHAPFVRKTVDDSSVVSMMKRTRKVVRDAFVRELGLDEISGRNLIVAELIERYVLKTLEIEKKDAPLRYLGSELSLEYPVITPSGKRMVVKGKVDRYDCVDGIYRIVDYKTGKNIHLNYDSVGSLFLSEGEIPTTAFQLMFYRMLIQLASQEGSDGDVLMEVIHTNELFSGGKHSLCATPEERQEYSDRLLSLLDEIMNPEIPFAATADTEHCTWCPFKILCGR